MPRKPLPRRQPKRIFPNGTQSVRERFANRLGELGYDPHTPPLLIAIWLRNPNNMLSDPELERLATDIMEEEISE